MERASEAQAFTTRTTCRACGWADLISVLDLGEQPLANGFRNPGDLIPEARYPLHLLRCPNCELVQLSVVVDPAIMYGQHYPYRSGYSEGWALHCHALAKQIGRGKLVLEIGCLDGVMLRHCRDNGCDVQGIDPSSPVIDLPIYREFFGKGSIPGAEYDVIVAQNVFGHVDDARGFLEGIEGLLAQDGYAVIECPWVVDLIDGVKWDTVYHEHLSYWGLRPLVRLADKVGLEVYDAEYFPDIHGGTMRYSLRRGGFSAWRVAPMMYSRWGDEEMESSDWKRFRLAASQQVDRWNTWFQSTTQSVAIYGASAKFSTFLNALPEYPGPLLVIDDSPSKIGLRTPGWGLPVVAPTRENLEHLDVLIVGAPNWMSDIERNARSHGFTGEIRGLWQ